MSTGTEKAEYLKSAFPRLYLEKAGETQIKHIVKAIEKVPWGITFLQLAWTAGPVTFLALQGGYYLGYGKTAPFPLFAYFAAYTIIAGLFAIAVSLFHNLFRADKAEKAEYNLLYAIDKLADQIIAFCDFRLSQLSPQERKYEAAHILLRNSHAIPASIASAIDDITDDKQIADTVKRIEIFRRAGLFARAGDLVNDIAATREELVQRFSHTHPEMARILAMRFIGQAPSLKQGLPRSVGFLERIYSSAEAGDLSLMSIRDAEECVILVFELINGRKIETLNFTYTGNKRLREAANNLERIRASYRISQATFNYRIRLLASLLIRRELINLDDLHNRKILHKKIYDCIDTLAAEILALQSSKRSEKSQQKKLKAFTKILSLYSLIQNAHKHYSYQQQQLSRAMKKWQTLAASHNSKKTIFKFGRGQRGLRLIEKVIQLDNRQKLAMAAKIADLLHDFFDENAEQSSSTENAIKEFAISLALITEPFIKLSHPLIQYGIESSNAANLGSLEQGISVQAKAGWTAAMVKEVEKDIGKAAEKLAEALVKQYGEELDPDAITFLHETYGARLEILESIKEQSHATTISGDNLEQSIPKLKPINRQWLRAKEKVQQLLY